MKKWAIRIILILALALVIYFSWGYFSLFKMTKQLDSDLTDARSMVAQLKVQLDSQAVDNKRLEEERIILGRELASAQEEMTRSKRAIDKLEQDLDSLKIHVSALERNSVILRSRIDNLGLRKKRLEIKIEELIKEKENLEARFSSIRGLRKAIRDLKGRPSKQRPVMAEKSIDTSSGNQGYLIKRGESTYKHSVNIRVLPAP